MQRIRINREIVKELHAKGLRDPDIAKFLGASVNGVRYIRKNILNLPDNKITYPINKEQEEIIIGTLLGDAWIGYVHKECKYPKYQVVHSIKQKEYTLTIYKKLRSIMTDPIIERPERISTFKDRQYTCSGTIGIYSHNCESLVLYRKAFYPNGIKIIPVEFIKDRITSKSLAYWYMDDGSKDKRTSSYIINTQCFSKENLEEFIKMLYDKFTLEFHVKKDNSLYLRHKCNNLFKSLIEKYITEDMRYKL